MLYAIKAEGRSVFYGTDTATLLEQTWPAFRQHKMRFDVVILDHTYGPDQAGSDHLSAHQVIQHVNRMRDHDMLGPDSRVFATHIAHEGNPAHPDLTAFAIQNGMRLHSTASF